MIRVLPLLGVWVLAVMSPGPDFLVTVRYATGRSRRHGIVVGLGVCSALTIWAAGSALGLAVLLARLSWLYDLIRYAGAAYLLYLGVRILWADRHAGSGADGAAADGVAADGAAAGTAPDAGVGPDPLRPAGLWPAWRAGFLTNIGNPKAAVFFGSLFGALMPAHAGAGLRLFTVAAMLAVAGGWFSLVAVLFGLDVVARGYRRMRRWIDRAMAAVLVALGGRLALEP